MSGHESSYTPTNAFTKWLDTRLPLVRFAQDTAINFPTPKNLNYWYTFGGILAVCLVIQILTGIILAMHYEASVDGAFASVERIMRDVPYGWLLRYIHANGASMFFLAVYIHMFRGLYYGSYKAPREVLWILGCVIYLLMMATAFLGYMLPWGQMSYHGANVITSLFGAIPLIGESLQTWILGGPSIGNQTLQRFFSLHYLLPFMIAGAVILHVWALHVPGNNNPTGVEVQDVAKDTVPFHPYYTVKDAFAIVIFLIMFAVFVFYAPNVLGHADNYIEANPLVTPAHIVPEWYLLPFYAILRAITFDLGPIPAKLLGVIFMFAAIAVLFILPWLIPALQGDPKLVVSYTADGQEATSEYKGGGEAYIDAKRFMESLPADANPSLSAVPAPTFMFRHFSLILTFCYFGFFVLLFFLGLTEKPKELPESIHKSVLKRHKASASAVPAE